MLINVLVGGNNLTAIMSLKWSSEGVISRISGKQNSECPNPSSPDWKSTSDEFGK